MFGVDIVTAGTASLFISIPTVFVGLIRYFKNGAFVDFSSMSDTILSMSIGSVIGATIGGMLVTITPVAFLKIILGSILGISAYRTFNKQHN